MDQKVRESKIDFISINEIDVSPKKDDGTFDLCSSILLNLKPQEKDMSLGSRTPPPRWKNLLLK